MVNLVARSFFFAGITGLFFDLISAHPLQCLAPVPTTTAEFPKVIQLCIDCPTTVVSSPQQTCTLTELTTTSSTIYCPTLGTYSCPTGIIVPTAAPCYETWTASCTIERVLQYSEFIDASNDNLVEVDLSIYVNGVCIETTTGQWPPNATGGGNLENALSPTSVQQSSAPNPSSQIIGASNTNSINASGWSTFPTKTASLLAYPHASPPPNRATWMRDNADKIKNKPLKSICLPGSHDSATYGLTRQISNLNGDGKYLALFINSVAKYFAKSKDMTNQMISQVLNTTLDGMAGGGRTTQRTISQQLDDGIRSFDFRVAVFNRNIIINHSMAGPLLTDVVSQITNWLATSTGEILWLSFTHPFDFNHAYSAQLRDLLTSQLGAYSFKQSDVPSNTTLPNLPVGSILGNSTSSKVFLIVEDSLIDGYPDSRLWTSSNMSWIATGGDYTSTSAAALFNSFATDYAKAKGGPIGMTTIISPTPDTIVKIGIQYVLNQYDLGLFKDQVYEYFNAVLKDVGIDYVVTDDGDYDSLYSWEDMLGCFSGRYGAITSVQPIAKSNQIFILSSDFNEDTTDGDMVGLAIQYCLQ